MLDKERAERECHLVALSAVRIVCCCCFCCLRVLSSAEQRANTGAQCYVHTHTQTHRQQQEVVLQVIANSSVEHSPASQQVQCWPPLSPVSSYQRAPVALPWTLTCFSLCSCFCYSIECVCLCVCMCVCAAY